MKILNFGSLNIDYVYSVDHILVAGETLAAKERNVYPGGKGLNQSISLARSGADVWHAGAIGKEDGQLLYDVLKEAKVNLDYLEILGDEPSGHTFIQVDKEGQNSILVHGGANRTISLVNIDNTLENFSEGDFLVLQNEINDVDYIIRKAKERKMKVALNVSPIDENIFDFPLDLVDFFLVNEIEISHLVEGDTYQELIKNFIANYPNSHLIMTVGSKGAYYASKDQCVHHDIFDIEVVDTTAAGDTFTGYFISSFIKGHDPEECLKLASAASALAVSKPGASSSIPTMDEVKVFLESH